MGLYYLSWWGSSDGQKFCATFLNLYCRLNGKIESRLAVLVLVSHALQMLTDESAADKEARTQNCSTMQALSS